MDQEDKTQAVTAVSFFFKFSQLLLSFEVFLQSLLGQCVPRCLLVLGGVTR